MDKFQVITNHKNLEYFFIPRKLTEHHIQWSLFLSQFNFELCYWEGSVNERANALFCHEQDMLTNSNKWIQACTIQLLQESKEWVNVAVVVSVQKTSTSDSCESDNDKWSQAWHADSDYREAVQCLQQRACWFSSHLALKISVSECKVNANDFIDFWNWQWIPNHELLCTGLIETAHASSITGHSGWEGTYAILSCEFSGSTWLDMSGSLYTTVMSVDEWSHEEIRRRACSNHYQSLISSGKKSSWTLSQIYLRVRVVWTCWWLLINWQKKWH